MFSSRSRWTNYCGRRHQRHRDPSASFAVEAAARLPSSQHPSVRCRNTQATSADQWKQTAFRFSQKSFRRRRRCRRRHHHHHHCTLYSLAKMRSKPNLDVMKFIFRERWTKLDQHVADASNINSFKNHLRKFEE